MGSQYKTASGQVIDMEALRLKNESTIAVGNMRVNARGDELGPGGVVVKDRNQRVTEHYAATTKIPTDGIVFSSAAEAAAATSLTTASLTADSLPVTGGIAEAMASLKGN